MTYNGAVKVFDFGISTATGRRHETVAGTFKGKFAYASPEAFSRQGIDWRSDIWSMGVVLWEALANRRLFKGANDLATLNQTLLGEIPDLRTCASDVSESLLEITSKALSRDVSQRYQSAQEMKADLELAFADDSRGPASRNEVGEFVIALRRRDRKASQGASGLSR